MLDQIKIGSGDRNEILAHIKALKSNEPQFRVIDVGATASGWSRDVLDAIVDFNEPQPHNDIQYFHANINRPVDWQPLLDYVDKHGKFDFSICTHTLEDLANPQFVCEQLSQISKGGYVAVPSKYREFCRFEKMVYGHFYRGYMHHRWIFTVRDNQLLGFPKLNFLEVDWWFDALEDDSDNLADMSFLWKDRLDLSIVNDDYLGPTPSAVFDYYRTLLFDDDIDALCGKTYQQER